MNDYNNFVQNNNKTSDNNSQNEKIQHKDSIFIEGKNKNTITNEPENVEEVHTINKVKNKNHKNKVKHITVLDLSKFSDEDSDVEILKIASPKSKVCSANDVIKSEFKTNKVNETIDINSTTSQNSRSNNNKVIHSAVGTWFITSNNIESVKSKKKKVHRDVENTFRIVETELKNKIDKSLKNLNKIKLKQSTEIESVKRKKVDNDYLKMNKKRVKTELNEPLHEDNKILDRYTVTNIIDNLDPSNVITEISKNQVKQVQNIDPNEFLKVTQTSLETEEMAQLEDHLDDKYENEQEKLIAEAFADDDIINEFKYL
jgi:hypothetical protein